MLWKAEEPAKKKKIIGPTKTCLDGAHGFPINLKLQYMILRDWEKELIVI